MNFIGLFKASFRDPRQTFRCVADLNLPRIALWQALALTVIVEVIFTAIGMRVEPAEIPDAFGFMREPAISALVQALFVVMFILVLHGILQMSAGSNSLDDVVLAVAGVQAILCVFSFAQLILLILAPPMAALLGVVSFVIFVWLLVQFITEAAQFKSAFGSVLIIAGSLTIAGIFAGILMLMSGIVDPRDLTNV
ncbi:MAG: YIP1 family protein [Deltaproteobacteria bacterium]